MKRSANLPFNYEVEQAEFVVAIRHALDHRYRRLCQAARADWERLSENDPSDACVTVRVQPSSATRGSGFVKSRRHGSKSHDNGSVPRFAH